MSHAHCSSLLRGRSASAAAAAAPTAARAAARRASPASTTTRRADVHAASAAEPSTSGRELPQTPWSFGFQCNERYLHWDESAQIQLIKIWLAEKLHATVPEVEARLAELGNVLPDLVTKMERARADVLYDLLVDPPATAARLLALRELLPRANVSALVAGHPKVMLGLTVPQISAQVADLRARLPGVDVDALLMREPMLLKADLPRLMAELARIAPTADPIALIVADPQMVLDMEVCDMPSTLEVDGVGLQ